MSYEQITIRNQVTLNQLSGLFTFHSKFHGNCNIYLNCMYMHAAYFIFNYFIILKMFFIYLYLMSFMLGLLINQQNCLLIRNKICIHMIFNLLIKKTRIWTLHLNLITLLSYLYFFTVLFERKSCQYGFQKYVYICIQLSDQ